ncbi:MAG TPA: aminoglycoside adenylyltransferase domain-containing protein, partial [Acidimicrobiales bacterium]|nr:aminoglycoside adenylyltransferase domain-containing protein [Acidimicrobiales bacterium]
ALDWAPSLELTRRHGIAILGAGPRDLIGAVPEELLLGACRDELAEWASYEAHWSLPGGVLAACRAWWFWEEGGLGSKIAAAAWALVRADPADAVLIERALDLYWQAVPHDITAREVITFVGNVERKISPSRPDPGGPGL